MFRTRELLGMMEDIEIVGGNKDRRYRLKCNCLKKTDIYAGGWQASKQAREFYYCSKYPINPKK